MPPKVVTKAKKMRGPVARTTLDPESPFLGVSELVSGRLIWGRLISPLLAAPEVPTLERMFHGALLPVLHRLPEQ